MAEEHLCSLKMEANPFLDKILPDASPFKKLRMKFTKLFLASKKHPEISKYLKSEFAIEKENIKLVRENGTFMIHPLSVFKKYWDVWIFVVFVVHLVITALSVGFHFWFLATEFYSIYYYIDNCLCVILFLDVILKFKTGYINEDVYQIELNPKTVFLWYLKRCIFDVLGSFPIIYVIINVYPVEDYLEPHFVPSYCIFTTFMYLFLILQLRKLELYLSKLLAYFHLSEKKMILINLIFKTLYLWHITACLKSPFDIKILKQEDLTMPEIIVETDYLEHDIDWLNAEEVDEMLEKDIAELENLEKEETRDALANYITSLLVTIEVGLHSGYSTHSDYVPVKKLVVSYIIILGWIYSTYIVVIILNLVFSAEISRNDYEEMARKIGAFCESKQLTWKLKDKIKKYFKYKYKGHYFVEETIYNSTTENLRREILMYSCSSLFTKISLFSQMSDQLLEKAITSLKLEVYFEGDIIVHAGDIGNFLEIFS